jgi:hypothetical protein
MKRILISGVVLLVVGVAILCLAGCACTRIEQLSADEFQKQLPHCNLMGSFASTTYIGLSHQNAYLEYEHPAFIGKGTQTTVYWTSLSELPTNLVAQLNAGTPSRTDRADSAEDNVGGYKVSKSYPLTKSTHGIDGTLQLLQDSRITTNLECWTYLDDKETFQIFRDNPPLGPVLRILSQYDGFVKTEGALAFDDTPVAWLKEVRLRGSTKPIYLLTRDFTIGMGSYAGPKTFFYEITDGKLKPIEYVDDTTKEREQIGLTISLKNGWKFVDSKDGKSEDILRVHCWPDFEDTSKDEQAFLVYYDRFHFDGKEWIRYEKIEKGFWENEEGTFPPLSKFPAVQ